MNVGLIGTGHMGSPIGAQLIAAGHELVVHDRNQPAADTLLGLGATWAASPRDVAERSSVVFTSLPGPVEVDLVTLGGDGILAGAAVGTVHVDLSTNAPSAVRRLAALEAEHGVALVDAPVSGGARGAEAGTLAVYAGGEAAAFATVQPLLAAFGAHVFHLGPSGSGCLVKLLNNVLALGSQLLLQEVMVFAAKAGVDPLRLHEVLSAGSAAPYVGAIPAILQRDWDDPTFTLALAAKDVALCVDAARELGVPMAVGSAVAEIYARSLARGQGGKGRLATLVAIETDAGVRVEAARGRDAKKPRARERRA